MTPPKLPGDAPIPKQQKTVIIKKTITSKYLKYQKPSYTRTQAVHYFSKRECLAQNPTPPPLPPISYWDTKHPEDPCQLIFSCVVVWFARSDVPLFFKMKCILHFTVYKLT